MIRFFCVRADVNEPTCWPDAILDVRVRVSDRSDQTRGMQARAYRQ